MATKNAASEAAPAPILSVDDDAHIRRLIDRSLREEGYTLQSCNSAESALALLRTGAVFSLLILDVKMTGETGFDLARRVREGGAGEANRDMPIVFVTGETDGESYEKSFDVGAYRYLAKPFTQESLIDVVSSVLHG